MQKLFAECQRHESVQEVLADALIIIVNVTILKKDSFFPEGFFFLMLPCIRVYTYLPFLINFSVLYQFAGSGQGFARRVLECSSLSLCRVFNVFH